ncbi:MAG: hypothetical protein OEU26_32045 [Candidatus Tectomicrobia bacterium]|nr:hypothetical protein [Candidatus Tectomicrobia bacterium]
MIWTNRLRHTLFGVFSVIALLVFAMGNHAQAAPTVIDLTQTGCQFLEPEGKDHSFQTNAAKDCKAINAKTGSERLSASKPLELKPGSYIFRVTNQNVPYELGFYLRGSGLGRLTLPKVSGGGLTTGKTQDYAIDLKEGSYVYSCPLNPTPDYPIVVKP